MTQKNEQITYVTMDQFIDKHQFVTLKELKNKVYRDKNFRQECVRRLGKKLLIIEENVMEYIENSAKDVK